MPTFLRPSPDHSSEIRKIARDICAEYGMKVRVSKHADSVSVQTYRAHNPQMRIDVCEALLAVGYEDVGVLLCREHGMRNHHIFLASEFDHAEIYLNVAKVQKP